MNRWGRDGLLCNGVTPGRDRGIDGGEGGPAFQRGFGGKPGGPLCGRRKVVAPMRFASQTTLPVVSAGPEPGNFLNFRM